MQEVLNKTLYQLRVLGECATLRLGIERRYSLDAVRMGNHADGNQYTDYSDSLLPRDAIVATKVGAVSSLESLTKSGLAYTNGSK
jgi:hypothetical protein